MATRVFAALYPPQAILDEAAALMDQVRFETGLGLRWMPVEQWHITLAFYGNTPAGALERIDEELSRIGNHYAPFELRLAGAGHFGHRTLWLGVSGDERHSLTKIAAEAREAGELAGLDLGEERAFSPHLTVARRSVRGRFRDRQAERGYRRQLRQARRYGTEAAVMPPVLGSDDIDAAVHALSVFRGTSFTAESLALMESTLGDGPGGGALHHIIDTYPLRGASAG